MPRRLVASILLACALCCAGDAPAWADPAAAATPSALPTWTSVGMTTWIRTRPRIKDGEFLGYFRTGSPILLKSAERVEGEGCPGGFYRVEPRGYVCRDRTVSAAPRPEFAEAAALTRGRPGPFPYGYGLSGGTPMYNRVPTVAEQSRYERFLGKPGTFQPLQKTLRSHEELAVTQVIPPNGPRPPFLEGQGSAREAPFDLVEQTIPIGSMLAYTRAFEAEGRTWLVSADHTIVPADRVRPFRPSAFHGVDLKRGEAKLPLAWMRTTARPSHQRDPKSGAFRPSGASWPVRSWVELTGVSEPDPATPKDGPKAGRYLETRQKSPTGDVLWIKSGDATVAERADKLAPGVKEGQKWFAIRLTQGTLIAYEGLEPVYATLVSPGAGGVPQEGQDLVKMSTTPTGTFYVTFKDKAATMSPETGKNRKFWIADVPHTMYFRPPFALHAAYWHERFGDYTSAGCVNLSPLDAEKLFGWADPQVPPGWQGASGAGASANGPTTAVVIRR